jgi:hypothetical protein
MTELLFPGGTIYPHSIITQQGTTYALVKLPDTGEKQLLVRGDVDGFDGAVVDGVFIGDLNAANAAELRSRLAWLNPQALGRQTSFGFGDRLGSATPGHIAALRAVDKGQTIGPVFAQQSVRENKRTGRTPQEVMDDALWGIVQVGWREAWGADADHIKEASDLAPFIAAGYTFYTLDPSDYVDNEAQSDSLETLRRKAQNPPLMVWP